MTSSPPFDQLLQAVLDGRASETEAGQFQSLLQTDARWRTAYVDQVRRRWVAGADLAVAGPARLELVDRLRLRLWEGQVTALVEASAHGLQIDSPTAQVVDRGTEFGVAVGGGGQTQVVVFAGAVDVTPRASRAGNEAELPGHATTQLTRGQAVRIDAGGRMSRLVSIRRLPGQGWSAVEIDDPQVTITQVRDNLGEQSAMCYQIVPHGLAEDAPAYVDRTYQWNGLDAAGLPPELRGADYVMTFNDDKRESLLELTVTLARPARLFVFVDERRPPPAWLERDFHPTGLKIGLDEDHASSPSRALGTGPGRSVDRTFSIWERSVDQPGPVTLGGNASKAMYCVAAVADQTRVP